MKLDRIAIVDKEHIEYRRRSLNDQPLFYHLFITL